MVVQPRVVSVICAIDIACGCRRKYTSCLNIKFASVYQNLYITESKKIQLFEKYKEESMHFAANNDPVMLHTFSRRKTCCGVINILKYLPAPFCD
jgi:hypothetical protein